METYKSRAELKTEAKNLLRGNWKKAILLNLIPTLFIVMAFIFILFISSFFIDYTRFLTEIASSSAHSNVKAPPNGSAGFGSGGYGIIMGLFSIGILYTFLDWLRTPNREIQPLRDATRIFRGGYLWPVLLMEILIAIFTFLWTILLIVPGIVKSLAYSQTYFIYKDLRESGQAGKMKLTQFITESRMLMDGQKWRYFVLQLSFIGWHILCGFTFGIGYLWLNPYINATMAAFYKDLAKDRYIRPAQ